MSTITCWSKDSLVSFLELPAPVYGLPPSGSSYPVGLHEMMVKDTHPIRSQLWGGRSQANIMMRMREAGLPIMYRNGATVYVANLITGARGGELDLFFAETPVLTTIYKRQYAPNFAVSCFKVDMLDKVGATRLVKRLSNYGYAKLEVDHPFSLPKHASPNAPGVAYSPVSMVTARMDLGRWFDAILYTAMAIKYQTKLAMINEAKLGAAQTPAAYLSELEKDCRRLGLAASIAEIGELRSWIGAEEDDSTWTFVLLWEIRCNMQMEIAAGDVVLESAEPEDIKLGWESLEDLDTIYVSSPAVNWLKCKGAYESAVEEEEGEDDESDDEVSG